MVETRKKILKCIVLYIVFLAGILVGLFLWERIALPFENPWGIVGELASIQYNPSNDPLRFIVLISLPSALLLAIYLVNSKRLNDLCFKVGNNAGSVDHTVSLSPAKRTILAVSLVIVAILVGVAVTTFGSSGSFDTFHEGETLGPAISSMEGKTPYRDFLFWHGIFQDPLRSVIAFNLFGKSIGAVRTFDSILKILQIILFAFFLRKIYGGNYLLVALTFIALIIFYNLISFLHIPYLKQIASRDIITFCFLLAMPFPQGFINNSNNVTSGLKRLFITNFLFSFIAIASFSYSIDRGFFLCATFLILSPIIYISFFRKHSFQGYYLVSSLLGLISGLLVLGFLLQGSFSEFLEFTFLIVPRYKDLLDGKVYPINTLPGLACVTLIAVNTYWVALKFLQTLQLNDKKVMPSITAFLETYLIEFCLLLLSTFMFRSALGRSGVGRVVYYSYLPYILFVFIVIKHYTNELLQRPGYRVICSYGTVLIMILFSSFCVYRIYSWNLISHNFPFMVKDSQFIPNHYKATIAFLKNNLRSDDDFFTMTSEGCWYYFIDKACPTRFPVVGFAATDFYQHEIVEDLKKSRVKFILYRNSNWTNTIFGFTAEARLPVIIDYIKQHYTFFKKIDDNELWIKAENLETTAQGSF